MDPNYIVWWISFIFKTYFIFLIPTLIDPPKLDIPIISSTDQLKYIGNTKYETDFYSRIASLSATKITSIQETAKYRPNCLINICFSCNIVFLQNIFSISDLSYIIIAALHVIQNHIISIYLLIPNILWVFQRFF